MRSSRTMVPAGLVMVGQVITHWFWLTIATQVGLITIPYLMNEGGVLYVDVLEHRAPALAYVVAFFQRALPMDEVQLLRGLNLLLVLLISLMVYALSYVLSNQNKGVAGLSAVVFWALWEPAYGNILFYFDSVLGLMILLAVFLWVMLNQRLPLVGVALLSGLALGSGTLVKQHGWAAVVLFGLWVLIWGAANRRRWLVVMGYSVGVLILPLMMVGYYASIGHLDAYIYWTYTFNLSGSVPPLPPTSAYVYKMLLTHIFLPVGALLAWREYRDNKMWLLLIMMWLAGSVTLLPKFGEIHTMTQLPILAVLSGMVIAILWRDVQFKWNVHGWLQNASLSTVGLVGVLAFVLVGWLWAVMISYVPVAGIRAGVIAHDEFVPLADRLNELKADGDTLFVLPALDGNPQLHLMTGMLPPSTWTTTHECMLCAPNLTEQLLAEWDASPPTYIVYFPDLVNPLQALDPVLAFMEERYEPLETFGDVLFNGEAIIMVQQDTNAAQ